MNMFVHGIIYYLNIYIMFQDSNGGFQYIFLKK